MGIRIISKELSTELATGAENYLLGNVFDKTTIEIEIGVSTYANASTDNNMIMQYTTGMIGANWLYDPLGQFGDFKIGDTIEQKHNSVGFGVIQSGITVINKLDNYHIQLSTALTLAVGGSDVPTSGSIFNVTTPVTAIKYFFNFIENSEAINYTSKINSSTQLLEADSVDATDLVTVVPMQFIGPKPYQIGSAEVIGSGVDTSGPTYESKFIITHETFIYPFALAEQWADIVARVPPAYFLDEACLKYVFKFIAQYQYNDPNRQIVYENVLDINYNNQGNTGWFNENYNTAATNYSSGTVSYKDAAANPVPGIIIGGTTDVTFTVDNTIDAPFSNSNTKVVLNIIRVPFDASEYNLPTNTWTLTENFVFDRALQTLGAASVDGDSFGGGYQVITDFVATYNSASQITLSFTVDMGTDAVTQIMRSEEHRYIIGLCVQDHTKVNDEADRVTLLIDANNYFIDTSDPGLLDLDEFKFLHHIYDDFDTDGTPTFKAYPEDEISTRAILKLDRSASLSDTVVISRIDSYIIMKDLTPSEFEVENVFANTSVYPFVGGVQAIGYSAPRVFHIPVAEDIRKNYQVNRRSDLDTTNVYYYEVIYPFMFRWEYWLPLMGVPSSFYDTSEPNNGQNRDWERYLLTHTPNVRTRVTVLKNGLPLVYEFDRPFIVDKRSDPHIKSYNAAMVEQTNPVTGDKYLLRTEDTIIESTWTGLGTPPDLNLSAVHIGIEVFEQGGSSAGSDGKYRMSSVWASDSDTWFKSYISNDKVELYLNGNDLVARVKVDKTKLPANNKYSITARLWYDNLNDQSEHKETFYAVGAPPTILQPDLPPDNRPHCCSDFTLKVLGYPAELTDDLKNDVSGFLYWFGPSYNSAALTLQQYTGGTWNDFTPLDGSNVVGTFYDFQFFTNVAGEQFIGYQLEWGKVLGSGAAQGLYRVKCVGTDFTGAETEYTSPPYCLRAYTADRANGTIRAEYRLSGVLGINEDDTAIRDLGNEMETWDQPGWYNSFRLPGYFGYPEATYKEDYMEYDNGQSVYITDEQTPEYVLKLKPVPFFVHEYMRTDVMQADEVLITDYNNRNANNYFQKNVRKNSGYKPDWKKLQSKLAGVEVKWLQRYNRLKKLRY